MLLAFALFCRMYIALLGGGALFWTDEKRYLASREAVTALLEGDPASAAQFLLSRAEHLGFRWIALIPAALERLLLGDSPPHARICAAFLSLFSVANLALIWRIARRWSGDDREALLALAFATASNMLFFFSRHCLPYDASLAFLLSGILIGITWTGPAASFLVGLSCGLGFLVYNGYWSVGAVILVLDTIWRRETLPSRLTRGAAAFGGLITPIILAVLAARLAGHDLIADARNFAGTVNQGDFGEGWLFLLSSLWHSDGPLFPGLVLIIAGGSVLTARNFGQNRWIRWLVAAILLVALWISLCDVIEKFVLYGRIVRAVVPFLALAAAGAGQELWRRGGPRVRRTVGAGCAALCVGGFIHMLPVLRQVFPSEFRKTARALSEEIRAANPEARLETLRADYLYSPETADLPPPHRVLFSRPHPQSYPPYLHEGTPRAQRPLFSDDATAMRLIELETTRGLHLLRCSTGSSRLHPFPGPIVIRLSFPPRSSPGREVLLAHGDTLGSRSTLLLDYVDGSRVRVGLVFADGRASWSEALVCDRGQPQLLNISLGSFYPPGGETAGLSRHAIVLLNGTAVLSQEERFTPSTLTNLAVGPRAADPSLGETAFSGEVQAIWQVDPRTAVEFGRHIAIASDEIAFGAFPGPVELRIRWPEGAGGRSLPIVSSGRPGAADLVFLSFADDRHVRFGLDHWGSPPVLSPLVEISPGSESTLLVTMGPLLPPVTDPLYALHPWLRSLRGRLEVILDGAALLSQDADFHPADPVSITWGQCTTGATAAEKAFPGGILRRDRANIGRLSSERSAVPPVVGPQSSPYHGTLEIKLRFPAAAPGTAQPILASGRTGAADVVFWRQVDRNRVSFGLDHWGSPSIESEPVAITPSEEHTLFVSIGSLHPGEDDPTYREKPQIRTVRDWLYVRLDQQELISRPFRFFPAAHDAVTIGRSDFGNTGLDPYFRGTITSVRRVPPESLGLDERRLQWPRSAAIFEDGTLPTKVTLQVRLPTFWDPGLEPLLISTDGRSSEHVFLRYRGTGAVQIGFRRNDVAPVLSPPIPAKSGSVHVFEVDLGLELREPDSLRRIRISRQGVDLLVLDENTPPITPKALFLGRDPFGTKGVRSGFSGVILDAKFLPPSASSRP